MNPLETEGFSLSDVVVGGPTKKQNHPPNPGGGYTLRKHPNRLALRCAAWSARAALTLHRHQSLKLSLLILVQNLVHLGFG